jgi:hypothetical protein
MNLAGRPNLTIEFGKKFFEDMDEWLHVIPLVRDVPELWDAVKMI